MTDRLVTVFGGSGFVGRYVVRALLATGARVRIAARHPGEGWYLKTQGGLGQTQFIAADITRADSVARALHGATAAVNLVGTFGGDLNAVHVEGARHIGAAAAAAGCAAVVHVSAIGADPASASRYGSTKGAGEAAVAAAFPGATILRPSTIFGREDQFINRFADLIATLPVVPVIRGGAKFQPIYVADVADAVVAALGDPAGPKNAYAGKTYEVGGPEVFTMAALNRWIADATGRTKRFVAMPDPVAGAMASLTGWLPGAPMTRDQWIMLQSDAVVTGADGLRALGVVPTPLEAVADGWLVRYRRHGRFAEAKG
ncbi:complex I NDUFA9 subunit family protein [Sphingomonas sp. SUN039]|uniref:complex I NDUFA9 subunit family protein n=1 Tax=Sphingomonas sp. SUN039 TaxID=2937787 RepID=UPI002164B385|nr:complex I NDUFA9 subunit family protein [Sphingomonas sp. SUN039]UVO55334.1 complex I NDUFA9 subunit family protein [Sphingomonas sp. SUN039]